MYCIVYIANGVILEHCLTLLHTWSQVLTESPELLEILDQLVPQETCAHPGTLEDAEDTQITSWEDIELLH